MQHQDLDSRLTPNIDYTRRDEITFSLMDCITCPISMEITDHMIIFNHQYYDRTSFDSHRFVPETDDTTTNTRNFLSQIRTMALSRELNNNSYEHHIHALQNAAASNSTPPFNRQLTTQNNQLSASSTSASSFMRNPPLMRELINVDGESVSSSSDSSLFDEPNLFQNAEAIMSDTESEATLAPTTTCTRPDPLPESTNRPPTAPAFSNIPPPPHSPSTTPLLPVAPSPANIIRTVTTQNDNPPPTPTNSGLLPQPPSTTPTPPFIPTVSQLSQATSNSSGADALRATSRQRQLPGLPSFLQPPGSALCVSILALAQAAGFEHTLCHGQRTPWFLSMNDSFFADGGIMCTYRHAQPLQVRRKFKEAENAAKILFEGNAHQDDPSGDRDEANLPAFARYFFEYFTFLEERTSNMNTQRINRQRNIRVNRSLIGQQPALSPTGIEPTFNPTTAPAGRERGTGEVAGEITINEINEIPVASSESSATARYPRTRGSPRRTAANDSRRGRPRNYNVLFPASLPPSTGTARSINIDRMEQGYTSIAESINNLAYQQRIRKRIDINKDLQHHVQMRFELQERGADAYMISTVSQTIKDLEEERVMSGEYERYVSTRISSLLAREIRSASTSGSSDALQSDSMDTDNADV